MKDLQIFDRCFLDANGKLTITEDELEGFKYTFARKGEILNAKQTVVI